MDDNQYAKDIMWSNGRTMRVVHSTEVDRKEKEALRRDPDVRQNGLLFLLEINEEPVGDFDEEQELDQDPTVDEVDEVDEVDDNDGREPTMEDLRGLTVARLKDLADKEEVDLTGLSLKDDILGRMALHFGLDPAS